MAAELSLLKHPRENGDAHIRRRPDLSGFLQDIEVGRTAFTTKAFRGLSFRRNPNIVVARRAREAIKQGSKRLDNG